ncbi:spore coat assembly protein ExsA [Clostridium tepidiprofundi DSM 19306]|uniref:Spore coat assembly protein ExsA n=1 Tax=Clostridium tepidiprofundi DSM 19306 TaxID=1121338 RepID=A0A151B4W1_9CLOT|nr:SPOCS domain-containing protein [Clostridium tepidiprofundi]KYH34945.1 spore coat assembly protein ExsA [Clostridium tepidiprofundi DSM 19306]
MELVKENIEYEQLQMENSVDTIVRDEYVIPDTHPDVIEILMLDAKPRIINKEVLDDKILLEGQIEYNLLYVTNVNDKREVYNVNYSTGFSNSVECESLSQDNVCEPECYVEHMECNIINERKICIEGIIQLKCNIYRKYDYEIVKDVTNSDDIQFWKNPTMIDKIIGDINTEILAQKHIKIPMDKPEIDKIIKYDIILHKKNVKVMEEKVKIEAMACIKLLYKSDNDSDVYFIEDEAELEKEVEMDRANSFMENCSDFNVYNVDFAIREDDLGESRIVDVDLLVKTNIKVMHREEIDMIEDAYSPSMLLDMDKREYTMNVMLTPVNDEKVVKGEIELDNDVPKPRKVIMCTGDVFITDKKILEDKVVIEGVTKTSVLYKTVDEGKQISAVEDEIPFTCALDIPGVKINMQCLCKISLENIEADIEAGTIAVKALIKVYALVNYNVHKEFLVDLCQSDGDIPNKKASITIYVVQNGDTLWKIAKRYFTTIDDLVKLNNIEDPDNIMIGQKLLIPGRAII